MLSRTASSINQRLSSKACVVTQKFIGRSMHISHRVGNSTIEMNSNHKILRCSPILCTSFIRSISQKSALTESNGVDASTSPIATDNIVQNMPGDSSLSHQFGSIPDAPVPLPLETLDSAAALVEPTFSSLGLGGWTPAGLLQQLLEFIHVYGDLPWWGTIAIATFSARMLLLPIVIYHQKGTAQAHNTLPGLQVIQNKLTDARTSGDQFAAEKYTHQMLQYMKTNDCSPYKTLVLPVVQMPVYLAYFFGLRGMANLPVESMTHGGLLWFQDLTMADPYYILPLITSAIFALTLKLGIDRSRLDQFGLFQYVIKGMPIFLLPFMINFPAALVWYWMCTNVFTLLQVAIFKVPAIREFLNIPALIQHAPNQLAKKKPFVKGFKEAWSNMKLVREVTDRQQLDKIQFNKAGRGPIPKTYSYNPVQKKSVKIGGGR